MLASYIRNSTFYESLASKHKEDIDWGDNAFSKEWKATTDHATNRFLYGITGGRGWDLFGAFGDIVGGGALSAVCNLGELAGSLVGSAGEYIQSRAEGMGLEEDVDDYIAERADAYIDKKSQALYEDILANRT
jgi:outer membrane lipoprotein SlyB